MYIYIYDYRWIQTSSNSNCFVLQWLKLYDSPLGGETKDQLLKHMIEETLYLIKSLTHGCHA